MAKVHPGRYTATIDGEFVVFVIGMRFNKLWKVHQWLPVFRAMPKMIATLMKHPEKGMLGARTMWAGRTITMIQYWRSFDHLERFSRDTNDPHIGPWIGPGQYECVYANMPAMGLAAVGNHQPVGGRSEAARDRVAAGAAT